MLEIFLFIVLIILSAFFSGAETAFFSLQHSRIRMMQEEKKKNANIIAKLKKDPQRLLITILIGNNVVNLFTASYAAALALNFFGSIGIGIATGVTTIFILVFGEVLPKSIAYTYNTKITRWAAKPIYFCYILFYPISFFLLILNDKMSSILKIEPSRGVTEKEIIAMARLGVEGGEIDYREHEMIENVFEFDDVEVSEAMTPLYKVKMLNASVPVDNIAHFVSRSSYSRYPVFSGEQDNIVGYINVNQIMRALNSDKRDEPLGNFIFPIVSVSENRKIESVFRSMKKDKSHMYLVYRAENKKDLLGIITMEDILEEIVGEIEDETDKDREKENKN